MVLVADTSSTNTGKRCLSVSCDPQTQVSSISDNNSYQSETYEGSDILMTPKLLENDNESEIRAKGIKVGGTGTPLSATHQAVILAKCLLIEKSTRHDEMQSMWL